METVVGMTVTQTIGLVPTSLSNISDTLAKLFSELDSQGNVMRVAGRNLIIPCVVGSADMSHRIRCIDDLTANHPGRYFLVQFDDSGVDMTASVSARCHGLGRSESVCSEVVELVTPSHKLAALPSVLRAHLLAGGDCDMYLCDSRVRAEQIRLLGELCNRVIFDSAQCPKDYELLRLLGRKFKRVSDIHWHALESWRVAIAQSIRGFEKVEVLHALERIEILTDPDTC
ncbi:MAG: glucose-6-phosphate dehydrogenase assembly protein OpcA, partial [Bdellovibrionales bacterium]|nr:glucose-6-phosphate dehydrogenase assembly protein OpcA [Bdellovibrionales bacterium]